MATSVTLNLHLIGDNYPVFPMATLQVLYSERYQKLRYDSSVPLEDYVTTLPLPTPLLLLQIPHPFLLHPPSHHAYLTSALSNLNLPPQCLHQIISLALNLATNNNLFGSYFIMAGLEYLHVEQTNDDDEIPRAEFRDMVNAGVAPSDDIDNLL